ncbi:MAG TPA: phosphopantetheine adenylyltransferase, partial [Archaeoglobus profundus]|nr:phosphopantetheine adenylyltransferase [Archaeoglobus profundus]
TLEIDFDYIVVSPETYPVALMINKKREELGKRPIKIVKVDFVLAEDGKPISSTRIKNGEIDRYGRLIKD